jgi:signal peptidase I
MEQDFLIQDLKRAETLRQTNRIRQERPERPIWREYAETAVIALVAALLLRLFVVSAYRVSSASMEGALFEGDYIFVNKLAYEYGTPPQQGDVIVFKYPNNPQKDFIKRIIGLPGETIEIADKIVYVDGQIAPIPTQAKFEDQRIVSADLSFRDNFGPYVVPDGEYFVMGDNRDDSRDSRFWGTVPMDHFRGKAVFVYWSWQRADDAPGWGFPYIIDAVQWTGHMVFNFPTKTRWERIGLPI